MKRGAVLALLAFGYFVAFPEDLSAVLVPVERLLSITNTVSPWVYGVVAAMVVSRALLRTSPAHRKSANTAGGDVPLSEDRNT